MKPSWTDVTSLGLLLFFALVMANGWPCGDWAFGWSAIGAIATIVTGGIAARIAYVQYQDSRLAEKERKDNLRSMVFDRVGQLENGLKELCEIVVSGMRYYSPTVPEVLQGLKERLRDYLMDDSKWPPLNLSKEEQLLFSEIEREKLTNIWGAVMELREPKQEYEMPLEYSTSVPDVLRAVERVLLRAQVVAAVSQKCEGGKGDRTKLGTVLDETLTFIRRKGMPNLMPAFAQR